MRLTFSFPLAVRAEPLALGYVLGVHPGTLEVEPLVRASGPIAADHVARVGTAALARDLVRV